MSELITALGLVLVIEGTLYALSPSKMKTMMRSALELPDQTLRYGGLAALAAGVLVVWLIRG